ncbi:MAG: hypothetical protein M3O30_07135 [Planctomycetota bacterium]|nr:hypothetical protein [Planctomycetota bacterium]
MAKTYIPDNIRIASQEVKAAKLYDLMIPGPGVPWEDRNSSGSVSSFLKTATGLMFHPAATLNRMRRPDSRAEANSFAMVCAVIWVMAVFIQSAFDYFVYYKSNVNLIANQYWVNTAIQAVLVGAGAFMLPRVASGLYFKLAGYDMTTKVSPELVHNTLAYLMAPSLVALIPGSYMGTYIGIWIAPLLALLWILLLWMAAGVGRLRIGVAGAMVSSVLTFLICMGIGVAIYFVGRTVGSKTLDMDSIPTPLHPEQVAPPQ